MIIIRTSTGSFGPFKDGNEAVAWLQAHASMFDIRTKPMAIEVVRDADEPFGSGWRRGEPGAPS